MNHTHNRKKLVASALGAAAAVATPALLLFGAGTAHATQPTEVDFSGTAGPGNDLVVTVVNNTTTDFGQCTYQSTPQWPSLLPPYTSNTFSVPANTSQQVDIGNYFGQGAIRTGTTWTIALNCTGGFFPVNVNGGNSNLYYF
jgi:hypothetical protein